MKAMAKVLIVLFSLFFVAGMAMADDNVAEIDQVSRYGGSNQVGNANNLGVLQHGSPGGNFVDIDQIGLGNAILQRGSAAVEQKGGNNHLTITQDGGDERVGTSLDTGMAAVYQEGTSNAALILQGDPGNDGHGHGNTVEKLVQKGSGTTADSTSLSSLWNSSNGNRAFIQQTGNDNTVIEAKQEQAGTATHAHNFMKIVQSGNDNKVTLASQKGNWIQSRIYQYSNNNDAEQMLYGTHSEGYIEQDVGDGNYALQEMGSNVVGTSNKMTAIQYGSGNESWQYVYGRNSKNNDSYVKQEGDNNDATTNQNGSGNDADIYQSGDAHIADIDQNGSNHKASISQYVGVNGNQGFIVQTQTGNQATVTQTGVGNFASVTQN